MQQEKLQEKLPIKEKIKQHLWRKDDGRTLRIGVGCAYVGKGEGDTLTDMENDMKVLMTTYEKGFRYYDTSADYQGGRSETMLGKFIKRIPRDSIFLATKSNFLWRTEKEAFQMFRDSFFRSFDRLNVDYIDLYQIHDTEHFGCCESEVVPFLLEQQKKGLIGYIGTGMRSLNAHELAVRSGNIQSVLSYQNYSLLTRAAAPLVRLCKEKDCAFINASVLHFGMIKSEDPMSYGMDRKSARQSYWKRWQEDTVRLQALCKEAGFSILAPALQYSLLNPYIDITLNGIHRISNIESTITAIDTVIRPEVWAAIQELQDRNQFMDVQDDLMY
jgi:aryl-alcohol dehydrogenase-like predicted oxidoreductase